MKDGKDIDLNSLSDSEKIASLHRTAEDFRTGKLETPWKNFLTTEECADMCDDFADAIEAGEIVDGEWAEEEKTPEQLLAEAENSRRIADLLKRHDAGSLGELIKRYSKKTE
jgi:hypothetical protein